MTSSCNDPQRNLHGINSTHFRAQIFFSSCITITTLNDTSRNKNCMFSKRVLSSSEVFMALSSAHTIKAFTYRDQSPFRAKRKEVSEVSVLKPRTHSRSPPLTMTRLLMDISQVSNNWEIFYFESTKKLSNRSFLGKEPSLLWKIQPSAV